MTVSQAGRLNYDKHLFLLQPENVDLSGPQAWQMFRIKRNTADTLGLLLFEEPLFFNSFIALKFCSLPGALAAPNWVI